MPRIISGVRKKMVLKIPPFGKTRPTTDRVKETIFNIITASVPGSNFLDLFAGTGQIGLEALSRGAGSCVFVEKDPSVFRTLNENIAKTGFENCRAYRCDALSYIDKCGEKFDMVYMDPPYDSTIYQSIIKKIADRDILCDGAKMLVEHDLNIEINDNYGILDKYREERYGNTVISFLKKKG